MTTQQEHEQNPIDSLNLDRYLAKLASREPANWTPDRLQDAAKEYRRFLRLRQIYPHVEFVPTETMDAVWHEHILDTRHYGPDMIRIFGHFLHHVPEYPGEDSGHDLSDGLTTTAMFYREAFGEELTEVAEGRCTGKACHAPTPCRCR